MKLEQTIDGIVIICICEKNVEDTMIQWNITWDLTNSRWWTNSIIITHIKWTTIRQQSSQLNYEDKVETCIWEGIAIEGEEEEEEQDRIGQDRVSQEVRRRSYLRLSRIFILWAIDRSAGNYKLLLDDLYVLEDRTYKNGSNLDFHKN